MKVICRKLTKEKEYSQLIPLIQEYQKWLGEDICYQGLEREMNSLSEMYGPGGRGAAFIGRNENGENIGSGCVRALPRSGEEYCEMKRLFVSPAGRGLGLGRMIAEELIGEARRLGYRKMRLDTLERLTAARHLYESLGFKQIDGYCENPLEGPLFYELDLLDAAHRDGLTPSF